MTDLDLDAIQARADAATEGPWELNTVYPGSGQNFNGVVTAKLREYIALVDWDELSTVNRENFEFIAHARTDIPALIAELKALRGKVAGVEALAQQIADEAQVDWGTERNFGAGQWDAACKIIGLLLSAVPTTGEPE